MFSKPRIYTIANAHLDTIWNWDFEHVINVCLKNTLHDNFYLFDVYPDYRFNFEGAYRYELFEEYYPDEFEKLKEYVAEGKWNVTGSAFENGDVNVPSPENLFRNILYGNRYFEDTFGKRSNDIFLPDCFGFGYALPSIIRHSNLLGFSTQKLTWGSAYGVPFDIGLWQGVDGSRVFASLDSRNYTTVFKQIRTDKDIRKKLNKNISDFSLPLTFVYHGTGDVGGAPKDEGVQTLQKEIETNETSDVDVLSSSPTEFFNDLSMLSPEVLSKLPVWNDELVMTNHGVGSYTSRAFSKRMNRRNEELADQAEKACVIASTITSYYYPKKNLENAWKRVIAHTFHDDITGTSVQRAYKRSWNDLVVSANNFTSIYEGAANEIVRNLDSSWTKGNAIVVSNMLEFQRTEVVEFTVPSLSYEQIRVFDSKGREVPSQVISVDQKNIKALLLANVPPMGFKVYDVLYSYEPCKINTGLRIGSYSLDNFKYRVTLNRRGDISSIVDKTENDKEILNKPIRFELNKYEGSKEYPAWELRFKELQKYPWEFAGSGIVETEEEGPCRITLKVTQYSGKSTFTYYVSLSAGCQYVSVFNEIEWREFKRALHNGFSFNVRNDFATYDLGLGCIERSIANKKLYSVPAQKWADITDKFDDYGVSVFSDSKYGWIMKDERTLRLTVLHSPKNYFRDDSCQGMLEFGKNRYGYAIFGHKGRDLTLTQQFSRAFNQPLSSFITSKHTGALGDSFSFISVSTPSVIVRAVKMAEDSDEIIVRLNEGSNTPVNHAELSLGRGIVSAREVFASEEYKGQASVVNDKLIFSLNPYEVKTFALKLTPFKIGETQRQVSVDLAYNINIVSDSTTKTGNEIPRIGASIPNELLPSRVSCGGVHFKINNSSDSDNAVVSAGQIIHTDGTKLYLLCSSLYGDKDYTLFLDGKAIGLRVQSINERIGAWDLYELAETGYIKPDKVALEITHTNSNGRMNVASQLYFFMYEINTDGVSEIELPDDDGLLILSATVSYERRDVKLISELYDRLEKRPFDYKMSFKEKSNYKKMKRKWRKTPNKS